MKVQLTSMRHVHGAGGRGAGVMCWYNLVRGVALVWKKHPIHKSHQDKSKTHIYTELLL